jgi:hypothetical protein
VIFTNLERSPVTLSMPFRECTDEEKIYIFQFKNIYEMIMETRYDESSIRLKSTISFNVDHRDNVGGNV